MREKGESVTRLSTSALAASTTTGATTGFIGIDESGLFEVVAKNSDQK